MSFDLGVMQVSVDFNINEYRKNLNSVEKESEAALNRITEMAVDFLSFRSINRFVSTAIKSFSDLENASRNFNLVFDEIPAAATKAEAEMRKMYNLSETTNKKMLSDVGRQLQAFGFSEQDSLTIARQIVERGIDLASYFGGSQEDAVNSIIQTIIGENDGMKRFGVVIQQDGEAFIDLTNKIKETTGATDLQAKAQAMFYIITEQTASVAGNYLKENSITVSQRQIDLTQATKEATDALGEFAEEGIAITSEELNDFLNGFYQTEKTLQNTELRAAALAAAFVWVARNGALAKENLAINTNLEVVNTAFLVLAYSMSKTVTTQLLLGGAFNKMKTSLASLNASIEPVGRACIALRGINLACKYAMDKSNYAAEKQIELSKNTVQEAKENASTYPTEHTEYATMFTRLEEERREVIARGTEKLITDSINGEPPQTAMEIMHNQYGMSSNDITDFQLESFDASRQTNLDNVITGDENSVLSDLQDKTQVAFAEQDTWESRIIEEEATQQSGDSTAITWSSEVLEAQLGRTIGLQIETAENTKQIREILRRMENKNYSTALQYGD